MAQRTKKLEIGQTKIATVRAKYKGIAGNFDVYYGNTCVPYVNGKMMILPKEKYLNLLKSFLRNEGDEYIAPTIEEASNIADRVWAKYEENMRHKKEEERMKAEAEKERLAKLAEESSEPQEDVEESEPDSNEPKEQVSDSSSEKQGGEPEKSDVPSKEALGSEESAIHAYEEEESERKEENKEEDASEPEPEVVETSKQEEKPKPLEFVYIRHSDATEKAVVTMTTSNTDEEKSNHQEENVEETKTEDVFMFDCETDTRFESSEDSEAKMLGLEEADELFKDNSSSESKMSQYQAEAEVKEELFTENDKLDSISLNEVVLGRFENGKQVDSKPEETFQEEENTVSESKLNEELHSSEEQKQVVMSDELADEIKRLIREQNKIVLDEQTRTIRKVDDNAGKLDKLLSENKSVDLNFDLDGLEKEFNKMNKKVSVMQVFCLLSLIVSLALGSVAAYFGLGYGDTLTLRNGEEVELHAIVHAEDGDRYSLLGTLSIDDNGEVIVEGAE